MPPVFKTAEQDPATSVLAATSPLLEGIGGRYFEDCNEAPVIEPESTPNAGSGVAAYAVDPTTPSASGSCRRPPLPKSVFGS
jgi:hypothetical protein